MKNSKSARREEREERDPLWSSTIKIPPAAERNKNEDRDEVLCAMKIRNLPSRQPRHLPLGWQKLGATLSEYLISQALIMNSKICTADSSGQPGEKDVWCYFLVLVLFSHIIPEGTVRPGGSWASRAMPRAD